MGSTSAPFSQLTKWASRSTCAFGTLRHWGSSELVAPSQMLSAAFFQPNPPPIDSKRPSQKEGDLILFIAVGCGSWTLGEQRLSWGSLQFQPKLLALWDSTSFFGSFNTGRSRGKRNLDFLQSPKSSDREVATSSICGKRLPWCSGSDPLAVRLRGRLVGLAERRCVSAFVCSGVR